MSGLTNILPKLLVVGDNLKDIYLQGIWSPKNGALRFKPEEILEFDGGAANTLANARAILGDRAVVEAYQAAEPLSLYRFDDGVDVRESYITLANQHSLELCWAKHSPDGIIISDYNKGTVNRAPHCSIQQAKFVIVDSRYRSVHKDWLSLGATRIWRCTGNEYDPEWARQFDFVVHTDGPRRIFIWSMTGKPGEYFIPFSREYYVPEIEVVDTCGAGDTFTAMLGAQLLMGETVYSAMPHCIKAAQEVCMKKYTAVTTEKL